MRIHHLPGEVVHLVRTARARFPDAWQQLVQRAWELPPQRRGQKGAQGGDQNQPGGVRRNFLYDDLFTLPEQAHRFLRTYLLRWPLRRALERERDPRREYHPGREAELISWGLTDLFLKGVLGMQAERIETIRTLGDRIADLLIRTGDVPLFKRLWRTEGRRDLSALLMRMQQRHLQRHQELLIHFDEYLTAFFEPGDREYRGQWDLARDLLLLRVIERLYARRWPGLGELPSEEPAEEEET